MITLAAHPLHPVRSGTETVTQPANAAVTWFVDRTTAGSLMQALTVVWIVAYLTLHVGLKHVVLPHHHARLDKDPVSATTAAKGIWFAEKIIANCSMQAHLPPWTVVSVSMQIIFFRRN